MFGLLFSNPLLFTLEAVSLVAALTIHEFAHAWMADRLGDPTPRAHGRLSLNPRCHLDPLGTLLLLFIGFGWGKPVEFDPYNLQHPRRDTALIALAGPASNILIAILLSLSIHLLPLPGIFATLVVFTIHISLVLAIFNLIPIHPLDGGKILIGFLPKEIAMEWDDMLHRYGMIILLFLIFPFGNSQSPVSYLISPIVEGLLKLLL